jgi:hypothetical protein
MQRTALKISLVYFSLMLPGYLWAKGLDDIQPPAEKNSEVEVPIDQGELKVKGADPLAVEKPMPRSGTSLLLEQKLSIAPMIAVASASGDGDSWATGLHGQIWFDYALDQKMAGFPLSAGIRYTGLDATPVLENAAYRGIVEGYFATMTGWKANADVLYFGGAEIGLLRKSFRAQDPFGDGESMGGYGAGVGAYGGMLWAFGQKLQAGSQMRLAVGSVNAYEVSGFLRIIF